MRTPEEAPNRFQRKRGNHLRIVQHMESTGSPLVDSIINQPPSESDPQGSYTGLPLDDREVPVQDADDL
ncbi:MAG: hypothetical protein HFE43_10240 [Oscillospiraceae bacterium]|jgi:hypothetical protein|nr:hypothetical protein [Oscillospiraceae bacterium]